jgi:magnesium-transporting ATPase (P-type)
MRSRVRVPAPRPKKLKLNTKIFWEIIGWCGVAAVLSAYFLSSFSLIEANSFWHHVLNFSGGVGVGIVSYRKKAYQPMAINIVWMAIAAIALVKNFI